MDEKHDESAYDYGAGAIQVLEGLEAVRKRPGMYVGNTADGSGLHHLLWEVVDNAVNEHLRGAGGRIVTTLHEDGSVTVSDDGRGIPVEMHDGVPIVELVMTSLHVGWKFSNRAVGVRGVDASAARMRPGYGVGISAVNALSASCLVQVRRDGRVWEQRYQQGKALGPLTVVDATERTGTTLTFLPDPGIFSGITRLDPAQIRRRMFEIAAFCPRLTLVLHHGQQTETFHSPDGLVSMVTEACQGREVLLPATARFTAEAPGDHGLIRLEVALQWLADPAVESENDGAAERLAAGRQPRQVSFVNCDHSWEGGSHYVGMRTGVLQGVRDIARRGGLLGATPWALVATWVMARTAFAIHVWHPSPSFGSRTRCKLVSKDALAVVRRVVRAKTQALLVEHPAVVARLVRSPG